MKRRTFLKFSSASAAVFATSAASILSWQPKAYAATVTISFTITEGFITQADGVDVYFRGFSADNTSLNIPGQAIIANEDDTIEITIENTLNTDHSFVIDDLNVDQFIASGDTVTFQFTADQSGSFLYYDGLDAPNNRLSGLHGAIAVMPNGSNNEVYSGSPTFVQQQFWLLNDIDPAWNNAFQNNNNPPNDFVPRYFTLNGLTGRPPGSQGYADPNISAMHDPRSAVHGALGDRTLLRILNAGMARHSVHIHANHMEWLTENGKPRGDIWLKDIVPVDANGGSVDVIFPFEPPPDAWPPIDNAYIADMEASGLELVYPMHLHDEMTQTSGGGLYMFGALTDIFFVAH
jgi:FtsP/CotA-like multicopper oxidase with cupredoxin domain